MIEWHFTTHTDPNLSEIYRQINCILTQTDYKKSEPQVTKILPNLWLGDQQSAITGTFIHDAKIKYIINITPDTSKIKFAGIKYYKISIQDKNIRDSDQIMDMLIEMARIINNALINNQAVLVHCKRGHHRSAALVAFYLMKYHNINLPNAICLIKSKRPRSFRKMTNILCIILNNLQSVHPYYFQATNKM